MLNKISLLSALVSAASGAIIWDGRFNDMTSSADLEKWSFSNPVGAYQYYIHGAGAVDKYVNLDASFKNPADTGSKQGVKITIDETAKWNGQSMLRTELIPQTSAAINKGTVYYHFSIKTSAENVPTATNEHQVAFFESHFTELKYGGQGSSNTKLQWHVGGVSKWDVELVADEWHNVAYEINFDAGSVTFWHSTGSSPLAKTAGPFTASTSSNGADWHLGVLRLPGSNDGPGAEDWFFSGVYIEDGAITTSVKTGSGEAEAPAPPATTAVATSAAVVVPTSKPAAATSTTAAVVQTPAPVETAAPVETPIAATSAAEEVPAASSTAIEDVPATSTAVAEETSLAPTTPVASAAPTASAGAGSGAGSDAVLPQEFTIKQFVAWLKARQGIN